MKKGLLVVSFGTSHLDTKEKTIDRITGYLSSKMPDYEVYEAFTSTMIIERLKKRDHLYINTPQEAIKQMIQDGVTEVIIQPTHILNGIEYQKMLAQVEEYKEQFEKIGIGTPLLTDTDDYFYVIDHWMKELPESDEKTAIILMGHGSDHFVNMTYCAFNELLRVRGYEHIYVGTVEAYPYITDVIEKIEGNGYEKVYLVPMMIVAGEHAKNDMIGQEEESWINVLSAKGYEVEGILQGMGEFPFVSELFAQHAMKASEALVEAL